MKIISPKQIKTVNLETEYTNFLNKLEEAQSKGKNIVYLDKLSYGLHLKLISENYKIRKMIKNSFFLGFIKKRTKHYCILIS